MLSLPNIQQLIDENRFDEALEHLNLLTENFDNTDNQVSPDDTYLMRGKLLWRMQRYAPAVSDFEKAVAINPESDARHALELARDIFDYYNPDLLNP